MLRTGEPTNKRLNRTKSRKEPAVCKAKILYAKLYLLTLIVGCALRRRHERSR